MNGECNLQKMNFCTLFNDAAHIENRIASNDRLVDDEGKKEFGRKKYRRNRGPIQTFSWREEEKPQETSGRPVFWLGFDVSPSICEC